MQETHTCKDYSNTAIQAARWASRNTSGHDYGANTYSEVTGAYRETDSQSYSQINIQRGSETNGHSYIHTYIATHMHTYIHTYTQAYVQTDMHTYNVIHKYSQTGRVAYIHTYINTHIRKYRQAGGHTCSHTYIHTYIHTHTY